MSAHFTGKPDLLGYRTTSDGRWKAKDHPSGTVTLTDTTRRAVFADTGASWTRQPDWPTVRQVVAAFDDAPR